MDALILYIATEYPWVGQVVLSVGLLRLTMKPIMSAILTYVENSLSDKDNLFVEKVKKNKYWKAAFWLLDYVASIKLPAPKKK